MNSKILIMQAIQNLVPGAVVVIHGDDTIEWQNPTIAPVTQDQIDAEVSNIQNQEQLNRCIAQAKKLLSDTDYSQLADVNLVNKTEFAQYRSLVRAMAITPVPDPVFPTAPTPIWN
jgi:hypothetical protein